MKKYFSIIGIFAVSLSLISFGDFEANNSIQNESPDVFKKVSNARLGDPYVDNLYNSLIGIDSPIYQDDYYAGYYSVSPLN